MKSTWLGLFGAPVFALALGSFSLSGCGGKVVVDADGTGGAGGATTSTGTNGTSTGANGTSTGANGTSTGANGTSTSAITSTSTGGPDPSVLCDSACKALDQVPNCTSPSCLMDCINEWSKAGVCQGLFVTAVACVVDNAGEGGICTGAPCVQAAVDYKTCMNQSTCTTSGICSGGTDGSCTCSGICGAGNKVGVSCFPSAPGSFTCVCSENGAEKGKCESPGDTFPCDIPTSCCTKYF